MTSKDDFRDLDQLREYLATQLRQGRLTLILGAGISIPFALPDWVLLIKRLYSTKHVKPTKDTPANLAEHFRATYYKNNSPGFLKAVRKALYGGVKVDFDILRRNKTLVGIGSLIMASRRGSTSDVYTFNFDNLLELYLEYHGFVTASLYNDRFWGGYADAKIFHPHGMLPFDASIAPSKDIVFDQASYSAVVGKENNPWRQRILTSMRANTCLFIGLSGRDMNLDSLLYSVKDHHASLDQNTAYWGVTFSTAGDAVARTRWQERGIFYHQIKNYDDDLPGFLFGVCQEAARKSK